MAGIAWKRFVLLGVARAVPWPGTRHRDRTDGPGLKESIVAAATSKEVVVPIIVVTRLRLRDPALLDEFFTAAVAALEQAKSSDGNLGADVLADANNAWWTLTAWQERGSTQAFVGTKPHLSTMTRLDDWCDEATFIEWEQASEDLPDWQTSYRRLIADGQAASLPHASDAHQTRAFPPPVEVS